MEKQAGLEAALQQALDLLRELRDCPLTDLEQRQEEIDAVIAMAEPLTAP